MSKFVFAVLFVAGVMVLFTALSNTSALKDVITFVVTSIQTYGPQVAAAVSSH